MVKQQLLQLDSYTDMCKDAVATCLLSSVSAKGMSPAEEMQYRASRSLKSFLARCQVADGGFFQPLRDFLAAIQSEPPAKYHHDEGFIHHIREGTALFRRIEGCVMQDLMQQIENHNKVPIREGTLSSSRFVLFAFGWVTITIIFALLLQAAVRAVLNLLQSNPALITYLRTEAATEIVSVHIVTILISSVDAFLTQDDYRSAENAARCLSAVLAGAPEELGSAAVSAIPLIARATNGAAASESRRAYVGGMLG